MDGARVSLMTWRSRLLVWLLPRLPTDQLILAIGNLESRDRLQWLRVEAWAEIDRCLGDPILVEAYGPALLEPTMRAVLQRTYVQRARADLCADLDTYLRVHWRSALWGVCRAWRRRRGGGV